MKLLFDQNLSFRLVRPIERLFLGSCHVRDFGMARAGDQAIWEFAKQRDFAIVTLDSDFHERSLLQGWPPKIVWLDRQYGDRRHRNDTSVERRRNRGVSDGHG